MTDPVLLSPGKAADIAQALERAAAALRRSLAPALAGPAPAEPMLAGPAPAGERPDFAQAMRRVEAEYYDAA